MTKKEEIKSIRDALKNPYLTESYRKKLNSRLMALNQNES